MNNIIGKLRETEVRRNMYPPLFVVKEDGGDPMLKMLFLSYMVEDRQEAMPGYSQFLNELKDKVNKGSF